MKASEQLREEMEEDAPRTQQRMAWQKARLGPRGEAEARWQWAETQVGATTAFRGVQILWEY